MSDMSGAESAALQNAMGVLAKANFLGGAADTITAHEPAPSVAPSVAPSATPVVEQAPVEPPKEEPKAASEPKLAELIRQQREARQAREQEATRAKGLEAKVAELSTELERLKRDSDFESDPVAYAKARGWDKEKQALMGQILLYDLVPDKAPQDLRQKLFESKQERKEREAQAQAEREAQERAQQAQQEDYLRFVGAVDSAVTTFEPGSYPESEVWFSNPQTGELDRDTYVRSLVATAANMAVVAQQEGRSAVDLTPASIARTLEAEVTRRMKLRDDRVQKRAGSKQGASAVMAAGAGGMQPTESTKGITGSGTPQPKAKTEEERLQRAAAVVFRPR